MELREPERILVIGCGGQVGWELCSSLQTLGKIIPVDRQYSQQRLDLTDNDAIRDLIRSTRPHRIVNAAAYTAVDRAETEPEMAHQVNAIAPRLLAEEAKRLGSTLIHYSTDYVFDGASEWPYDERMAPKPINIYGASKLAGEVGIKDIGGNYIILRTSWVYGTRGHNFLLTIKRRAAAGLPLRVVNDQIGAPTWSRFLAVATGHILCRLQMASDEEVRNLSGLYHLTASGHASWYAFAHAILESYLPSDHPAIRDLSAIATVEYPTPAQRPMRSLLNCLHVERSFGIVRPDWRDMLTQCVSATYADGIT